MKTEPNSTCLDLQGSDGQVLELGFSDNPGYMISDPTESSHMLSRHPLLFLPLRKVRRRCLFEPTWRPVVPRLAGRAHFVLWKHEKNRSHPRPNPHPSRPRAPQVRGNRLDSLQCKITLRPLSTFCNGLK